MKVGGIFLGYGILAVLLFTFGVIEETSNPFMNLLLYGGNWESFFGIAGLISLGTTTFGAVISIYGLVTRSRFLIMAGLLTGVIFNYLTLIYPIVNLFPNPLGYIIYGILSIVLIWSGIEFWGGTG
jgi:hypothetical protein